MARAAEESSARKLLKAGADRVISPYQIAGRRMASVILRPTVMNFLDVVVEGGDVAMRLEEVRVAAGSAMVGKELAASGIGKQTGAVIVGIHGPDGSPRVDRRADTPLSTVLLREGDVLIALGNEEQIASLKAFAGRT